MNSIRIYSSKSKVEAIGIQHALEDQNITVKITDKTDTSHAGLFGDVEIYVDQKHLTQAKKIVEGYLNS